MRKPVEVGSVWIYSEAREDQSRRWRVTSRQKRFYELVGCERAESGSVSHEILEVPHPYWRRAYAQEELDDARQELLDLYAEMG